MKTTTNTGTNQGNVEGTVKLKRADYRREKKEQEKKAEKRRKAAKDQKSPVAIRTQEQEELIKKSEEILKNLKAQTWRELETKGKFGKNDKLSFISDDMLIVGCDIGSELHYIRAIDTRGREISKKAFSFENNEDGFIPEYQIYCFHGKVKLIEKIIFAKGNKRVLWDENYNISDIEYGLTKSKKENPTKEVFIMKELAEELAKGFIDNADLIVYMSNAKFAGTKQDFEELKTLHDKKKRFLLLLTRSDTTAWVTDENGKPVRKLVPVSDDDRNSMEGYVFETLDKNGIHMDRGTELLTVSVKLAHDGLKSNDESMFDGSNMKRFLEVLVSITQNEAAKLKLATPSVRINAMIDDIIKKMREANDKLSEHMKSLDDKRRALSERNDYLQSSMLNECISSIRSIIEQKAAEVESGRSGVSAEEIQQIIGSEVYRVVMDTCKKEFAGSEAILSGYSDSLKVGNVTGLEMRHDTITWKRRVTEYYERDPDGFFEYVGAFFGRKYYGSSTRTITETKNVDIGVNLHQVLPEIRSNIESLFAEQVPGIMKNIADSLITPVAEVRNKADKAIKETIHKLEGLKKPC